MYTLIYVETTKAQKIQLKMNVEDRIIIKVLMIYPSPEEK